MLPLELQKIKKDIEDSNKIYDILEQFKYALPAEDIKKRYLAMITPHSIMEEVEKKKKDIEIKKVQLEEKMIIEQD